MTELNRWDIPGVFKQSSFATSRSDVQSAMLMWITAATYLQILDWYIFDISAAFCWSKDICLEMKNAIRLTMSYMLHICIR